MAHPSTKSIIDAIWEGESRSSSNIWAIVDAAHGPDVYSAVDHCLFDKSCLYSYHGRMPPELAMAAPYLVKVYPSDYFLRFLVTQGWGKSWAIFLRCGASMRTLRRHLRRLLVVRDPRGKRLAFRYYDPRVLRVFLPTCSQDQLQTLFGPIKSFMMEGDDSKTVIRYRFDGEELTEKRVDLTAEEEPVRREESLGSGEAPS